MTRQGFDPPALFLTGGPQELYTAATARSWGLPSLLALTSLQASASVVVMNPNAQKWVEALESGEFRQGQYALSTVDTGGTIRHCCLGVACELAAREGVIPPGEYVAHDDIPRRAGVDPNALPMGTGILTYKGEGGVLPEEVKIWLGLRAAVAIPNYSRKGSLPGSSSLAALNDLGVGFGFIADAIRTNADYLFRL